MAKSNRSAETPPATVASGTVATFDVQGTAAHDDRIDGAVQSSNKYKDQRGLPRARVPNAVTCKSIAYAREGKLTDVDIDEL